MKKKIEAVLFSSGRSVSLEELSKLCGIRDFDALKQAVDELKKDYEEKESALKIIQEGNSYKLNVKEEHIQLVQKIVVNTELSKTLIETLAVIAWKYPILQSDVIKIRTNKAYDHLKELEELGFISRELHKRTKKIRLTEHFFEYFDLPSKEQSNQAVKDMIPNNVQESVNQTEQRIEQKEEEIEHANQLIKEQEKEIKEKKEQNETEMSEVQEPDAVPEQDTELKEQE